MSYIFTQKQLEKDNDRVALIFLGMVLVLMALWGIWLAKGAISIYEPSEKATVVSEDIMKAEFPLSASTHLQLGQNAIIEFDNLPWPSFRKINGVVKRVLPSPELKVLFVYVKIGAPPPEVLPLVNRMGGKILVEIGSYTPFELIMRRFGELLSQKRVN